MAYTIGIAPRAMKQIADLPIADRRRVAKRIDELAANPRPMGVKKLEGQDGFFRVRAGDFRIIYTIQDRALLVLVVRIGNRREVYRS